ncbi:sulfate ABC transporter substrate-binding protein [Rubrobacter taiwanensis]|uniref:sulfate ABC transporter substrate-binding protein n=1 Tax=Rubrobacter taiwanensis TaxID=185139 RepID=UPI001A9CFB99|nr:sulfate ABC transporter substrate-binding protein [Rubrobacter taiwanensis]
MLRLASAIALFITGFSVFGCGVALSGGDRVLLLAAYSTPREAYAEVMDAFQRTEWGRGVEFEMSYGASGEQSRAVEAGLPADVVGFSLEPDMRRLVEAGVVAEDWDGNEYRGMVTNSVVVLVVRRGNPEGIRGWEDLIRPGVDVITPSPATSGGAKWNVLAAYGAQLARGGSEEEAAEYVRRLFENVSVQDKSARESLQTFVGGKGDVMIAYESEAIIAREMGYDVEYVVPEATILIENPYAVTETGENPEKAREFLEFLYSPEAQRIFGEEGYRPVVPEIRAEFDYPEPEKLFTIEDFGGWEAADERFFDPEDGIVTQILREAGGVR